MFERNDSVLRTYKVAITIILWLFALGFIALGIAFAIILHGAYFLIAPFGVLACYSLWLRIKLHISYLCDIKLIRNKLYGESNAGLEEFLQSTKEQIEGLEEEERKADKIEAELAHYYQLMLEGQISEEEYRKREEELESIIEGKK